jgi:oxysterol-binding protein-related protein 3/6/7
MRNIVAGTKYLEHVGTMQIFNSTTGERCEVEFKESGMWGASNIVNATVFNSRNRAVEKMSGKWNESIALVIGRNQLEILWRANELPPVAQEYYGFTSFTMGLNEFSEDLKEAGGEGWKIPATDSRWRPDQRALEEGRLDEADELKMMVEEKQRVRRRAGKDAKPRWFSKVEGEDEDTAWGYTGGYWEARDRHWKDVDVQPLW